MTATEKLLPCPFCGGEAKMCHVTQLWEPKDSYWAKCVDCHTSGKHHKTEAEAIAAWNTRSDYHGYEQAAIEAWEHVKEFNKQTVVATLGAYDGTRWHELFGTPERAARMLIDCNAFKQCVDCPVCHDEHGETCEIPGDCVFVMRDYRKLLEWLRGDAE